MEQIRPARIHLDSINGAPLLPEVEEALQQAFARLANPSSLHSEGRAAAALREKARGQVAALIGARSEEITFTSSGTEANQWALMGLGRSGHIVLSAVEHLSILQTARRMEKQGWQVTLVPVDRHGWVDPEEVERALKPETALVSVQWANGEVGTLQPIAEIARRVKARGILFHSDAVAAAGQVEVDMRAVPVDALSLAANVWGGPPGVGALYLRKGTRIQPLFVGGAQEEGRRAGTENLLGIIGMGASAAAAARDLPGLAGQLVPLRERLVRGILNLLPETRFNGHPVDRLPGHASLSFPGVDAEGLVLSLDRQGVAVGLGSACSSQTLKASHVLKAMGVEEKLALGTITLTMGWSTTEAEVERVLELFPKAVPGTVERYQVPKGTAKEVIT